MSADYASMTIEELEARRSEFHNRESAAYWQFVRAAPSRSGRYLQEACEMAAAQNEIQKEIRKRRRADGPQ